MVANRIINNEECCYILSAHDILKLDNCTQPKHCLQKEALHVAQPCISKYWALQISFPMTKLQNILWQLSGWKAANWPFKNTWTSSLALLDSFRACLGGLECCSRGYELPCHTPQGRQPSLSCRSAERLWKACWQTPLLYPSGSRRTQWCSCPGNHSKDNILTNKLIPSSVIGKLMPEQLGLRLEQSP